MNYLLTFRPSAGCRRAVREGLPRRATAPVAVPRQPLFWGVAGLRKLQAELPLAVQVPLPWPSCPARGAGGFRVPQSGFLHEPTAGQPDAGTRPATSSRTPTSGPTAGTRSCATRTSWPWLGKEHSLLHVLFSTIPDDLDLYDKPMARNVQLWTEDYRPAARRARTRRPRQLKHAMRTVQAGGAVRLPLPLPGHARRQARGLLAPAARRLPDTAGRGCRCCRMPRSAT